MKHRGAIVGASVLALVIGVGAGGFGGYQLALTRQQTNPSVESAVDTSSENNPYDVDNLSLTEMYTNLREAEGDDFDHRLVLYTIAVRQNESGFLTMAQSKSEKDPLRDYAKIQLSQNDRVVTMLYDWQGQWGYNHH